MDGIIVVNKPDGLTSHDVVAKVRRKFNMKRVGHAGTLDPLATGVLVVLLGKSTKLFDEFVGFDKAYRATLILGRKTTSADIQGETISEKSVDHISSEEIKKVFKQFVGEIEQVPPMVSAVKMKGKKLYQLARKGVVINRPARNITIRKLEVRSIEMPQVEFYVECSKGTYVRQLAEDIGEALGCGACICQIERTKVGEFEINEAVKIEDINESHIRNWQGKKRF
ncbi:MAG: tRNA pseudouridine(55) synthase TruB [Candidatus Omnitrophica bacterium]|nr:tRNA pseudouridine(55) synthase TruB [Candidatus Omnitrophota bacterium]MCB9747791.1 tRNA pseudouridine(55) synthase TruB [Candidatus Omnitrophota bacterium]